MRGATIGEITQKGLTSIFEQPAWAMYLLTCLLYVLVTLVQQTYILTDAVYYETLGEQLSRESITSLLRTQDRWAWVTYALIPVSVFLQALLITCCLNIGAILLDYPIGFRPLFRLVVNAVSIFAVGKLLYTAVLLGFEIRTMDDLFRADVFSLLGLIGKSNVPAWLVYPLNVVNVFEVLFWLILAGGLMLLIGRDFRSMLGFVAGTYGAGLVLWILLLVFLQLTLR